MTFSFDVSSSFWVLGHHLQSSSNVLITLLLVALSSFIRMFSVRISFLALLLLYVRTAERKVANGFVVVVEPLSPSHTPYRRREHHRQQRGSYTNLPALAPQQLGSFEQLEYLDEQTDRTVVLRNMISSSDPIPFETAWDWQKQHWDRHADRLTQDDPASSFYDKTMSISNHGVDTVYILEHAPVYTLGTGSDPKFILGDNDNDSSSSKVAVPTIRMDRGGEVTYHGPGQITVYPILDLRSYRQDIHWYMRALEEVVLTALHNVGIEAERQDDTTGVWYQNHKLAAIGIKCRKWVTQHGFAVNVLEESLENFEGIVPCGLEGRKVGCINQFLDEPITMEEFSREIEKAMEQVFQIKLVEVKNDHKV